MENGSSEAICVFVADLTGCVCGRGGAGWNRARRVTAFGYGAIRRQFKGAVCAKWCGRSFWGGCFIIYNFKKKWHPYTAANFPNLHYTKFR